MSFFSKTIKVPRDFNTVISIDRESETDPTQVDMSEKDVEAIWRAVLDLYKSGIHPAITICLRRKGKIVLNRAIGHVRGNGPKDEADTPKLLVKPDTPFCLFSASKAISAMLIHLMVEQNLIHLADPVAHYIPEFAANGKQHTTIQHILTHKGGFPRIPKNIDPEMLFDRDALVEMLCAGKPVSAPGSEVTYHAITGGFIFDEIIRRITGEDMRAYLEKNIKKPLGMQFFSLGLPASQRHLAALNYYTGVPPTPFLSFFIKRVLGMSWDKAVDFSNDPRFFDAVVPSANIYATAEEACRFYQVLLNHGELNGVPIFHPLTVRRAVMPAGQMVIDRNLIVPIRYSQGFMLGAKPIGLYGPFSQQAYGHVGLLNILCWADPLREISVAILNSGKALLGPHLKPLVSVVNKIAWHTRGQNRSLKSLLSDFTKDAYM